MKEYIQFWLDRQKYIENKTDSFKVNSTVDLKKRLNLTLSTEVAWNYSTLEWQLTEDFYKNYITVWKLGDIKQQSNVNLLNVYIFSKCAFFPIRWYFFWNSCTKHTGKSGGNRWKFRILKNNIYKDQRISVVFRIFYFSIHHDV